MKIGDKVRLNELGLSDEFARRFQGATGTIVKLGDGTDAAARVIFDIEAKPSRRRSRILGTATIPKSAGTLSWKGSVRLLQTV